VRKIPTLFERNYDGNCLVRDAVVPGTEWVLEGEGIATEKYDGTACLVREGQLFARYDCKVGRTPPQGFESAQDADPVSGHWPGWVPVTNGPEHQYHREAFSSLSHPEHGRTLELVGPKVQKNPYKLSRHYLWEHGMPLAVLPPLDFEGLRTYLANRWIEGIVWHHADGRMAKIKRRDFGLSWPAEAEEVSK